MKYKLLIIIDYLKGLINRPDNDTEYLNEAWLKFKEQDPGFWE